VFGWLFAGAGLRDLRVYHSLSRHGGTSSDAPHQIRKQPRQTERSASDGKTPGRPLASRQKARTAEPGADPASEHTVSELEAPVDEGGPLSSHPVEADPIEAKDDTDSSPLPDGGYLAGLARERRPPRL